MRGVGAIVVVLLLGPSLAAAQPETPGPYAFDVWRDPPGAPIPVPDGIYYPTDAPCPGAPVALVHGFGESGAYKVKMAELLASRGLVAILPTFGDALVSPTEDHGRRLNELLAWVVGLSEDPASPIAGRVDGSMLGLAGHSNGGVVFYAAAMNPDVTAVVGWDAVAGSDGASGISAASLHLLADGMHCGGGRTAHYDAAPAPKAMAVVVSSSHCDFNDPASPFCVPVCGTPPYDPMAAAMIERYSVAWLVCLLGHDPTMADYVTLAGGAGLSRVAQEGTVTCRPAACDGEPPPPIDAGPPGDDAGPVPPLDDAGPDPVDAGRDAGAMPGRDAGGSVDAGGGGGGGGGGCAVANDGGSLIMLVLVLALAFAMRRKQQATATGDRR